MFSQSLIEGWGDLGDLKIYLVNRPLLGYSVFLLAYGKYLEVEGPFTILA
tara:strand:- start:4633 stop:4782 length:150 start_codon:yes stop_codon:yes gene_type:complete